jgi:predicted Fe-Mo cluster-binding NifX family protein
MSSIAISIQSGGDGLSSPMDGRFGRAARFALVDAAAGTLVGIVDNPAAQAAHGAGTATAALLGERAVNAVISGRFGPQAFEALGALGIEMWIAPPGLTAQQALDEHRAGRLERMKVRVFR